MEGASDSTSVLVTGAGGFIATHIIKQLQEEGYKVRGTLRSLEDEEKVKRLNELCPEAAHKLELVEADLTKAESWEPAVKDITYVIHVASPFPSVQPKDENEVIQPAVDGTQAILKACVQAKSVKKVVLTSSSVAVHFGQSEPNKTYTEEDWMEPDTLNAYGKSKTMAEKAAWEYVKELPDEDKIELAVINPAYVMGPVISGSQCASMDVIKRLMERSMMFLPKLNFSIVDVRDVAAAHIKAMTTQEASGKRFLLVNENMWMKEIAQVLAKEFKSRGYNVPTTNYPNAMLHMVGIINKNVKAIIPQCGKVSKFDNTRMKEVLGVTPRETKDTLIDMAYSMVEGGFVKKSKKYRPQGEEPPEAKTEEAKTEEEKKEGEEEKPKENGDVKEGEKEEKEEKEGEKVEDDLKKEEKADDDSEKDNKDEKSEEKKEETKEEVKEEAKEEVKEEVKTEEKKETTEEQTTEQKTE